jgi:hypothetical protein
MLDITRKGRARQGKSYANVDILLLAKREAA